MLTLAQLLKATPTRFINRANTQCRSRLVSSVIDVDDIGVHKKTILTVRATDGPRHVVIKMYGGDGDADYKYDVNDPAHVQCSCVHPDTRIASNHGLVKASDFVAAAASKQVSAQTVFGAHDVVRTSLASKASVAVKLDYGFELSGAYNHLVLVITPTLEIEWRRMCDIGPGDFVGLYTGRTVGAEQYLTTEAFVRPRMDLVVKGGIKCPECGRVMKRLGRHPETHMSKTEFSEKHGNVPWHADSTIRTLRFPKTIDEDVAALAGYIISEGCLHKDGIIISNADKTIIEAVVKLSKKAFNVAPAVYPHASGYTGLPAGVDVRMYSRYVRDFFEFVGLNFKKSYEKSVPESIFKSPQSVQIAFLKAIFSGDGSNDTRRRTVRYHSASKQLVGGLQTLLLSLGIVGSATQHAKNGSYMQCLNVTGRNYDAFMQTIGFVHSVKGNGFVREIVRKETKIDLIPYSHSIVRKDFGVLRAYATDNPEAFDVGGDRMSVHNNRLWRAAFAPPNKLKDGKFAEQNLYRSSLTENMNLLKVADSVTGNGLATRVGDILHYKDVAWMRVLSTEELGRIDGLVDLNDMPNEHYVSNGVVSHNCPWFLYVLEVSLASRGSSDVVYSNGAFPKIRNPVLLPALCVSVDAEIESPAGGTVLAGSVQVGDCVPAMDGNWTVVKAKTVRPAPSMLNVKTVKGSLPLTPDHPVLTIERDMELAWVNAEQLVVGQSLVAVLERNPDALLEAVHRHDLPMLRFVPLLGLDAAPAGDVVDFETDAGHFVANGTVVHNCKHIIACVPKAITAKPKLATKKITKQDIAETLKTLKMMEKKKVKR